MFDLGKCGYGLGRVNWKNLVFMANWALVYFLAVRPVKNRYLLCFFYAFVGDESESRFAFDDFSEKNNSK